jgi:hypothetical protein
MEGLLSTVVSTESLPLSTNPLHPRLEVLRSRDATSSRGPGDKYPVPMLKTEGQLQSKVWQRLQRNPGDSKLLSVEDLADQGNANNGTLQQLQTPSKSVKKSEKKPSAVPDPSIMLVSNMIVTKTQSTSSKSATKSSSKKTPDPRDLEQREKRIADRREELSRKVGEKRSAELVLERSKAAVEFLRSFELGGDRVQSDRKAAAQQKLIELNRAIEREFIGKSVPNSDPALVLKDFSEEMFHPLLTPIFQAYATTKWLELRYQNTGPATMDASFKRMEDLISDNPFSNRDILDQYELAELKELETIFLARTNRAFAAVSLEACENKRISEQAKIKMKPLVTNLALVTFKLEVKEIANQKKVALQKQQKEEADEKTARRERWKEQLDAALHKSTEDLKEDLKIVRDRLLTLKNDLKQDFESRQNLFPQDTADGMLRDLNTEIESVNEGGLLSPTIGQTFLTGFLKQSMTQQGKLDKLIEIQGKLWETKSLLQKEIEGLRRLESEREVALKDAVASLKKVHAKLVTLKKPPYNKDERYRESLIAGVVSGQEEGLQPVFVNINRDDWLELDSSQMDETNLTLGNFDADQLRKIAKAAALVEEELNDKIDLTKGTREHELKKETTKALEKLNLLDADLHGLTGLHNPSVDAVLSFYKEADLEENGTEQVGKTLKKAVERQGTFAHKKTLLQNIAPTVKAAFEKLTEELDRAQKEIDRKDELKDRERDAINALKEVGAKLIDLKDDHKIELPEREGLMAAKLGDAEDLTPIFTEINKNVGEIGKEKKDQKWEELLKKAVDRELNSSPPNTPAEIRQQKIKFLEKLKVEEGLVAAIESTKAKTAIVDKVLQEEIDRQKESSLQQETDRQIEAARPLFNSSMKESIGALVRVHARLGRLTKDPYKKSLEEREALFLASLSEAKPNFASIFKKINAVVDALDARIADQIVSEYLNSAIRIDVAQGLKLSEDLSEGHRQVVSFYKNGATYCGDVKEKAIEIEGLLKAAELEELKDLAAASLVPLHAAKKELADLEVENLDGLLDGLPREGTSAANNAAYPALERVKNFYRNAVVTDGSQEPYEQAHKSILADQIMADIADLDDDGIFKKTKEFLTAIPPMAKLAAQSLEKVATTKEVLATVKVEFANNAILSGLADKLATNLVLIHTAKKGLKQPADENLLDSLAPLEGEVRGQQAVNLVRQFYKDADVAEDAKDLENQALDVLKRDVVNRALTFDEKKALFLAIEAVVERAVEMLNKVKEAEELTELLEVAADSLGPIHEAKKGLKDQDFDWLEDLVQEGDEPEQAVELVKKFYRDAVVRDEAKPQALKMLQEEVSGNEDLTPEEKKKLLEAVIDVARRANLLLSKAKEVEEQMALKNAAIERLIPIHTVKGDGSARTEATMNSMQVGLKKISPSTTESLSDFYTSVKSRADEINVALEKNLLIEQAGASRGGGPMSKVDFNDSIFTPIIESDLRGKYVYCPPKEGVTYYRCHPILVGVTPAQQETIGDKFDFVTTKDPKDLSRRGIKNAINELMASANATLSNAKYDGRLDEKEMAIAILLAIKHGGIMSYTTDRGAVINDLKKVNNLAEDENGQTDAVKLYLRMALFAENFQKLAAKEGFLTGNSYESKCAAERNEEVQTGLRLKRLPPNYSRDLFVQGGGEIDKWEGICGDIGLTVDVLSRPVGSVSEVGSVSRPLSASSNSLISSNGGSRF